MSANSAPAPALTISIKKKTDGSATFRSAGGESMRMRFLAARILTSCVPALTQVAPGQEFELAPGPTVQLAETGVILSMVDVANDSRCPVDVVCVTAGNAEVRFRVRGEGDERVARIRWSTP